LPGCFYALDEDEREGSDDPECTAQVFTGRHSVWVGVLPGQWIIRGKGGAQRPLDADAFADAYEPVT
jgi:hypothetical protein